MTQHDLDYDRAWDKVSKRFWRRRWRELIIHTVLYIAATYYAFLNPQAAPGFTPAYGPLIFLHDLGFQNVPWIALNWGVVLAAHILLVIGFGIATRIFRYSVERELLRDFARANHMDEKRKHRPAYNQLSDDEIALDYKEGETGYQRSAR